MATSAFKSTTKRSTMAPEPDYIKNVPRGKFVNTERGSTTEISLDDLAFEFFSSSSLKDNTSIEIGRWADDTASSRRRGRSVSRTRGDASSVVKKVFAPSRRRRSLSTSRSHQFITDSESEVVRSWNSSKHDNGKMPIGRTRQMSTLPTAKNSSNRQLGRSRSNKDLSVYLDGYSSQSSALTDEESRDTRITKNGFEKIVRTVYTRNKADDSTEEMSSGGMCEATKKELGCAYQDIQTELNQDKAKHDLLAAMMLEEQQCSMAKELPNSRTSSAAARPSRDEKRGTDRSRVSKKLIEEADKIIEDFVSSVEDTDISSFDGERSDCSSSFGGKMKSRNSVIREEEFYKSPMGSDSHTAEMDGIILPWLQWETSGDGSLSSRNNVTPIALKWDSKKENVMLHDPSNYSIMSYGSWNSGHSSSPTGKQEATSKSTIVSHKSSSFDMEEYLKLENDENILFQMYRKRNRISSGGLLLCRSGFV